MNSSFIDESVSSIERIKIATERINASSKNIERNLKSMNDWLIYSIFGFILLMSIGFSFAIGSNSGRKAMEKEAQMHGYMGHNEETGKLEWK